MTTRNDAFWQEMMEKISVANEDAFSKADFLRDTCVFFNISHAFIYEGDYSGSFYRQECHQAVHMDCPPEVINLKSLLGLELLSELSSSRVVIVYGETPKTPLEKRLKEILNVNLLILIPVLNQHFQLAGFVGLSDRRKAVRNEAVDIKTSTAVLSLLANQLKLEMFKKGIAFTEQALGNVLDHVGIDIYVNDFYTHDVLYVNKSMAAPYGGISKMLGKKCWQTIFNDKDAPCEFCPQPKLLDEEGKPTKAYSWDYERPFDNSWFRVFSSAFQWTDGRLAHLVASVDITESKRNEMLIQKMARFDHLTGLPNRRSLFEDIEKLVQAEKAEENEFFMLFCDLDGFKIINDTQGHHAGDVLLTSIGENLKRFSSDTLRVYRHGGDEFVVLIEEQLDKESMQQKLDALLDIFCRTYRFEGTDMRCGCSVGVAHHPKDATTAKDLIHLADMAMYAAKKAGKGTVRFSGGDEECFLSFDAYFKG